MATPMTHAGLRLCRTCFTNYNRLLVKRYLGCQPCLSSRPFALDAQQPISPVFPRKAAANLNIETNGCTSLLLQLSLTDSPSTLSGKKKTNILNDYPLFLWRRRSKRSSLLSQKSIENLGHSTQSTGLYYHVERTFHQSSKDRCAEQHRHRKEEERDRSRHILARQRHLTNTLKAKVADLSEDIKTVPNLLTLMRMLSAPVLGYLVIHEQFNWAVGLFVLAGITDLMDGYIARNFKNQKSVLGSMMDPLADKLLVTVLAVTLTMVDLIPVPLVSLIIARDLGLIGAAFCIRYLSLPPPKTVARYFDLTLPTAKLYPSTLSKVNTAIQLSLVALTLAAPVFDYVDHPYLQALWYITALTTFSSGFQYVMNSKSFFKILQRRSGEEKLPRDKH